MESSATSARHLIDAYHLAHLQARKVRAYSDARSLVNWLTQHIAQRLSERLQGIRLQPNTLLDAGCGIGQNVAVLYKQFPRARYIGHEHCAALLNEAARQHAPSFGQRLRQWFGVPSPHTWLNADLAQIPLPAESVDLVWSNLALHWHDAPTQVCAEWQRLLRVDGLVMFSCLGPDSLRELRTALGAEATQRLIPLVDMHDYGDMLVRAGFADPVMDMERLTLTYTDPHKLLREIASLGGNPLQKRPRGLLGRERYQIWLNNLQQQKNHTADIPLTLEIIYGHAWKVAPKQKFNPHEQAISVESLRSSLPKRAST